MFLHSGEGSVADNVLDAASVLGRCFLVHAKSLETVKVSRLSFYSLFSAI